MNPEALERLAWAFSEKHFDHCVCRKTVSGEPVGWVVPQVPPGHALAGKAVPCYCTRMRVRQRTAERMQAMSGLSARELVQWSFGAFRPERCVPRADRSLPVEVVRETMAQTKAACARYAREPKGWLILQGVFGSGKTHLAFATAAAYLPRPVFVATVPDLLDILRAGYDDPARSFQARFEAIRTIGLLVLDDLGAEQETSWASEKLFQILNYRYAQRLPTVITMNGSVAQIGGRLGSRLREGAEVDGPDKWIRILDLPAGDYRPYRRKVLCVD